MMHKNSHPNEVARNSVPVYPGAPRPNQPAIIIYVQKPIDLDRFTDVVCQIVLNWPGQEETSAAVP